MNRSRISAVVMAALMTAACLTGCGGSNDEAVFGTAATGAMYSRLGKSFTEYVKKNSDIKIRTRKTAGSASNVRLMNDGYIQFAVVQGDILSDAYNGERSFQGEKYDKIRAVAGLYTEPCQVITLKDSGIDDIYDLDNKKVSIGEKESGTEQNALQILAAYGLSSSDISVKHDDYAKAADELKTGKIDAFFVTAGAPAEVIATLAEDVDIKLLPVTGKPVARLLRKHKDYTKTVIKAGTYKGQKKDIETIGVRATMAASADVSEADVETFTKLLFADREELSQELGTELSTESEAVQNITIPFHKGAAKYYESKSISVKAK